MSRRRKPSPRGRAPGMQVQLLSHGEETREYAVIFGKGDEAFSGMLDFAEKYHITSAHFTAIGALNGATLAWFDPQRKMYKKIPNRRGGGPAAALHGNLSGGEADLDTGVDAVQRRSVLSVPIS